MTKGLTIRFRRDPSGRPLVMFIRDWLWLCPSCGHERFERLYDETDFHCLTAAAFRNLATEELIEPSRVCDQCAVELGNVDLTNWSVTYGFPASPGLIQGFSCRAGESVSTRFSLSPERVFDVQMLPEFEVAKEGAAPIEAPSDQEIFRVLGRYLSPKAGWRRALKQYLESDSQQTETVRLSSAAYGIIGPGRSVVEAEFENAAEQSDGESLVSFWLHDPIGDLLECGPREWLPASWLSLMHDDNLAALAVADVPTVTTALSQAVLALPLEVGIEHLEDDAVLLSFPVGEGDPHQAEFDLRALAAEALACGVAPCDWLGSRLDEVMARLAGERELKDE